MTTIDWDALPARLDAVGREDAALPHLVEGAVAAAVTTWDDGEPALGWIGARVREVVGTFHPELDPVPVSEADGAASLEWDLEVARWALTYIGRWDIVEGRA